MLNHYEYTLGIAIQAAIHAGNSIMKYYQTNVPVENKQDNSPVTIADKESQKIILNFLEKTSFPVISEEIVNEPYSSRQSWNTCWVVDPLDGTKEFLNRNGEFTVNIALIEKQKPVVGVIFNPVDNTIYFANPEIGSFKATVSNNEIDKETLQKLPIYENLSTLTMVVSRSHSNQQTEDFISALKETHPEMNTISCGSSIKLCRVAEGEAHLYPRYGRTMEWDTAAGHAILIYAGAELNNMETLQPLTYNKENLDNPYFIAFGRNFKL
jgi:3'(2'), 5'-bisphosphate nucleotidase